jgi:DNA-binding PucR family transcriptional regulator
VRAHRADAPTRALIASKGSDLQALSGEDLSATVETVRAFSKADLNVTRAAEQVHVHPNTVRYRLQRIATTTGRDPRTFAGLVELLCIVGDPGVGSAGEGPIGDPERLL